MRRHPNTNEIRAWLVSTHRFDPVSADRVVWVKVPQGIQELILRFSNLNILNRAMIPLILLNLFMDIDNN